MQIKQRTQRYIIHCKSRGKNKWTVEENFYFILFYFWNRAFLCDSSGGPGTHFYRPD